MRDDVEDGKQVSPFHTFVFFLICLFFTGVALHWELKHRRRFRHIIPLRCLPTEEILTTIADFDRLKTCRDPLIENFVQKHPEFSSLNRLWVLNSTYWTKRYQREARRRGAL